MVSQWCDFPIADGENTGRICALMASNGKQKTRKAVSKRFSLTGTGKLKRSKQGKRHLLQCKNRKRKRQLRKPGLASAADLPRLLKCMPHA